MLAPVSVGVALLASLAALLAAWRTPLDRHGWLVPTLGVATGLALAGAHPALDLSGLVLALGLVAAAAWIRLGVSRLRSPNQPIPTTETTRWVGVVGGASLVAVGAAGRIGILEGGALTLGAAAIAWLLAETDQPDDHRPPASDALLILATVAGAAFLAALHLGAPAGVLGLYPLTPVALLLIVRAPASDRAGALDEPLVGLVAVGVPLAVGLGVITAVLGRAYRAELTDNLPPLVAASEVLAASPTVAGLEPLLWTGLATLAAVALLGLPAGRSHRRSGLALVALGVSCAAPGALRALHLALP